MKAFVLLVTWFVPGVPPSSYQAVFETVDACEIARHAIHSEERRMTMQAYQRADAATGGQQAGSLLAMNYAPAVTAVCVPR